MTEQSEKDDHQCIRCDEPVEGERQFEGDWTVLAFKQERHFFPIHDDCVQEVMDRDLY